jgi:hypothetical protein
MPSLTLVIGNKNYSSWSLRPLPDEARRYVLAITSLPAMQEWIAAAKLEKEFIEEDEPYRSRP